MILLQKKCMPCAAGAAKLTEDQINVLMGKFPDWQLIESDGIRQIRRAYTFKNFKEALTFTNKVGELAESEGHHPAIRLEWGLATVTYWTHKIKGLHENDFIMAAKTEALY